MRAVNNWFLVGVAVTAMTVCTTIVGCGTGGSGNDRTPVVGGQITAFQTLRGDMSGNGAEDLIELASTIDPEIAVVRIGTKAEVSIPLHGPVAGMKARLVDLASDGRATVLELWQFLPSKGGAKPAREYRFFSYREGSLIATPPIVGFHDAVPTIPGDRTVVFNMRRCAAGNTVQTRQVRLRMEQATGFLMVDRTNNSSEPGPCK